MEISKRIRHEHAELRTLAQRILSLHESPEQRDRDFSLYERQLREHLDMFETFFLKRLKEDPDARDSVADIKSEHALIRKELKGVHRSDKDTHQWSAEFRRFTDRFEHLCHRHDALVSHAEASGRSEWLDKQYEETRSRRARSLLASTGNRGTSAALVVGAAAAAGAAFFLTRYLKTPSGRELSSRLRGRGSEQGMPSGILKVGEARPAAGVDTRPAFDFPGNAPAPESEGARTAPDPAKAPNASGITIG